MRLRKNPSKVSFWIFNPLLDRVNCFKTSPLLIPEALFPLMIVSSAERLSLLKQDQSKTKSYTEMTPRKEAPGVTPYNFLSCLGLRKLCSLESNATKTLQRSECILGCLVSLFNVLSHWFDHLFLFLIFTTNIFVQA